MSLSLQHRLPLRPTLEEQHEPPSALKGSIFYSMSEKKDPVIDQKKISRIKTSLLQDVRTVGWDKQARVFHLNTKLHHLVTKGCLDAPSWLENCEKLVACLPESSATCGFLNESIDPFRGARQAFPSNRPGTISDVVLHVEHMWICAKLQKKTAHTGLDHGNLVEILEMSGVLPSGVSDKFYRETLGMHSTPSEDIEDLASECEGDIMLNIGDSVEIAGGGILYQGLTELPVLWEESSSGFFLSMDGCGCVCRWLILFDGTSAVGIQAATANHTSITNLGERVRDACRRKFGAGTKCYEFYEPLHGEQVGLPCEITGEYGSVAGWMPVSIESLPHLDNWLRKSSPSQMVAQG